MNEVRIIKFLLLCKVKENCVSVTSDVYITKNIPCISIFCTVLRKVHRAIINSFEKNIFFICLSILCVERLDKAAYMN